MSQVRRLLAGAPGPLSYTDSQALHGPMRLSADLHGVVEHAGLRGRGGGGFPLARKLASARDAKGRPVVVVNAAEGEPASSKDRTLLSVDPHLVLDGGQAAAFLTGATQVVVAAHDDVDRLRTALGKRPREVPTRIVQLAPGYVTSEASAVVSAATAGLGLPVSRTRPLAQGGPGRRPWVVCNAETLAGLALVARHGAHWHRQVGTDDEPGTLLLTVSGGVRRPQVVEVPVGTPLRDAVRCAGGLRAPAQAVLVGGFAGRWLPAATGLDAALSHAGMRTAGGTLGAGVVVVLPAEACGLAVTARIMAYLAAQGARQCGPCLNGLPALAASLTELAAGGSVAGAVQRLERWCGLVDGRGACAHPDGAVALVRSAMTVFADDVRAHGTGGCGRDGAEVVAVPA
ncbi:MAG: hypothetical protein JWM62_1449 [Frankiales bacterium]|nr:hypothetical protein [Frankiales bacterium]